MLSMVASTKLLHLLEAFSTPWFLFSSPTNHHLVFFLLEIFNNIIQYQFDGKIYLSILLHYCFLFSWFKCFETVPKLSNMSESNRKTGNEILKIFSVIIVRKNFYCTVLTDWIVFISSSIKLLAFRLTFLEFNFKLNIRIWKLSNSESEKLKLKLIFISWYIFSVSPIFCMFGWSYFRCKVLVSPGKLWFFGPVKKF